MKKSDKLISVVLTVAITSCSWEKSEPTFDCSLSQIAVDIIDIQATSCGSPNGSLVAVASGGEGTFEYRIGNTVNSTGVFENLGARSYVVEAKDANGCKSQIATVIENTDGVNLASIDATDSGCGENNGTLTVNANGGEEPYLYKINGQSQSSNVFTDLARGNYTITVQDNAGCESTTSKTVNSGISYDSSVKNIIVTNCAISGCHNGSQSPDLRSFSTIQSRATSIKSRTSNRSMPLGRSLSQSQIDAIACWVDDGAPSN